MPGPHTRRFTTRSAAQTAEFGRRLGGQVGRGDVVLLSGPIGAGKTHFARALIQHLLEGYDAVEDVPSPTYTLVQTYFAGPLEIWHADLYRLSHPDEVQELGLTDAYESALCLIEWPDRLGGLAPLSALSISFAPGAAENDRLITISASDPRWTSLMATLGDA